MDSLYVRKKEPDRDWLWMDNAVIDRHGKELGVYGIAVYATLARYAYNGRPVFASVGTIAKKLGMSVRMAHSCLDLLIKSKLIEKRSGKLKGQENQYVLLDVSRGLVSASIEEDKPSEGLHMATPATGEGSARYDVVGEGGSANGDIPILKKKTNTKKTNNTALPVGKREDSPKLDPEVQAAKAAKRKNVIELIDLQYKTANPGLPVPWSPLAFVRLKKMLETFPAWGEVEWGRCIDNRYQSDAIIKGDPPEVFIPHLKSYISGPLTQFGKAKEQSNGNHTVNARTQRNRNAVAEVHARIDARAARFAAQGNYGAGDGDGGGDGY